MAEFLLPGDSSGHGDFTETGDVVFQTPSCVVDKDSLWGEVSTVPLFDCEESAKVVEDFSSEEGLRSVEVRGYASWEESCLVYFSEFLGFSTEGHKEEIIGFLQKLVAKQNQDCSKGQFGSTKCEWELKQLECSINYYSLGSGKGAVRNRGFNSKS